MKNIVQSWSYIGKSRESENVVRMCNLLKNYFLGVISKTISSNAHALNVWSTDLFVHVTAAIVKNDC